MKTLDEVPAVSISVSHEPALMKETVGSGTVGMMTVVIRLMEFCKILRIGSNLQSALIRVGSNLQSALVRVGRELESASMTVVSQLHQTLMTMVTTVKPAATFQSTL